MLISSRLLFNALHCQTMVATTPISQSRVSSKITLAIKGYTKTNACITPDSSDHLHGTRSPLSRETRVNVQRPHPHGLQIRQPANLPEQSLREAQSRVANSCHLTCSRYKDSSPRDVVGCSPHCFRCLRFTHVVKSCANHTVHAKMA